MTKAKTAFTFEASQDSKTKAFGLQMGFENPPKADGSTPEYRFQYNSPYFREDHILELAKPENMTRFAETIDKLATKIRERGDTSKPKVEHRRTVVEL